MRITVYHDLHSDAGFGLNQVFTREGKQYQPRSHPLVAVFRFDDSELPDPDETRPTVIADMIYRCFNVGNDPAFAGSGVMAEREMALAWRYRARRLRSLSKGDVLRFGDRTWLACGSYWDAVEEPELNIVDGAAAEQAVRDRYQFKPGEELAISVPLIELRFPGCPPITVDGPAVTEVNSIMPLYGIDWPPSGTAGTEVRPGPEQET
jgi:hypothetical protein